MATDRDRPAATAPPRMRAGARAAWVVALAFLLAACGRAYTVVGAVVVVDGQSPGISEIVGGPIPRIGTPVPDATVTLHHALHDGQPARDATSSVTTTADAAGHFELRVIAGSGTTKLVGLEVSAPGHETAFTTFVDYAEPDAQYFLVVLRRR